MSLSQAQAHLRANAPQKQAEEFVPLRALVGRILSREIRALTHVPPFLNSAVDGYAYRTGQGGRVPICGQIAAGDPIPPPHKPKTAVRIFTGAPLPPGSDTVVMDEDAVIADDHVLIPSALQPGSNARAKGEDIRKGQILYPAGHEVRALDLARLVAGGQDKGAWVHQPLRVQILSSGDEIRSGQIADANHWLLRAVFSGPAFDLHFGGVMPDDVSASVSALSALDADLILTSGGVSVGQRDVLRQAIETLGELAFWRVGIKPGRPVAFGTLRSTPIFGLPGNPVACFVTAQFLASPFARAMLGAPFSPLSVPMALAQSYKKKPGRTEFVRAHVDENGQARPFSIAGAGVISSLTQSDGMLVLGDNLSHVPAGTFVPFLPFQGILT